LKSSVSKQGFESCDRVYTRRMMRQRTHEQLQKEKYEPETGVYDTPVKEFSMKEQSKKKKGKQPARCPYRPKTRPTNKLRLKSKALFKPSLKEDNLIILEDDNSEQSPKKGKLVSKSVKRKQTRVTKKGKKKQPLSKTKSSQSDEGTQHDPTYNPEIQELSDSYEERTYSPLKVVKEEIIEETSSKEHKYETRSKKPKLSIDLNMPALEEDHDEHIGLKQRMCAQN
jgi:hypothetical protein